MLMAARKVVKEGVPEWSEETLPRLLTVCVARKKGGRGAREVQAGSGDVIV
jgi:hypothetical protein